MSTLRVDNIKSRTGTAVSITASNSLDVSGALNVTGAAQLNAATGIWTCATLNVATLGASGDTITVPGNLTVQGTETILNTETLDIADKTIGIGSTSTPSNVSANGGGLQIYGSTDDSNDKKLTWNKDSGCFQYNQPNKLTGIPETVATATTYYNSVGQLVLEMDARNATVYTYTIPASKNIGIVSFKNIPANAQSGTTLTLLTTQAATTPTGGIGNTAYNIGLGTYCTVCGFSSGAIAGVHTRGFVGAGATFVGLTTYPNNHNFTSFFVHYNGGTNTDAKSYKVFVNGNNNFQQSTAGA